MAKIIKHIGTPRHSGRYPWGSGKNPRQRNKSFLGYIEDLQKQGMSDTEIAKGLGISRNLLTAKRSLAIAEERAADHAMAVRLKEKGYSNTAIGKKMGINESSVRALLDPVLHEKSQILVATTKTLKDAVDSKGLIDVGAGVEQQLSISKTRLTSAVKLLEEEGYTLHEVNIEQAGAPGKYTTIKVLAPPGTTSVDAFKSRGDIKLVNAYSEDTGRTFRGIEPPTSINSDRVYVRFKDDGGDLKDGVIELRRNVNDLDLGGTPYAQVRIAVDGTHYMKGMAIYSDDVPRGYDIIYNTNKGKGTPIKSKDPKADQVFKPFEDDDDNPFSTTIRQKYYIDKDGNRRLSPLNIVGSKPGAGEEGSWDNWSRNLSSQILSKQAPALAKKQLGLTLKLKEEELDEILSLTNPAVKKALLKAYADEADAAAVHLKAASLPRQGSHVLIPINSLKDNEIYAPNYKPGELVVVIRHPHGGIFEIPQLRVNNKNPEAKRILGDALDAVGVNKKVADRLSGADFDGDAVIVIPNKNKNIITRPPLDALKDFDPKLAYKETEGMKYMTKPMKQQKMGDISNLITDMTIKGANFDEIARAVKHSMVVIDAEKHKLNYEQSYIDNNIADLKKKYQGGATRGASTLISRASSDYRIPQRKEGKMVVDPKTGKKRRVYIDPDTGEKLYETTGRTYKERKRIVDPDTGEVSYVYTGKIKQKLTKTTRMAYETDAFNLSSGTRIETVYAIHANSLKGLANKARLSMINTKDTPYSPSARQTYSKEASSLASKLRDAYRNKPLERQAQLLVGKIVAAKRRANPYMDKDELKKIKGQALEEARARFKAKKPNIEITDREWEAIQAGAITPSALGKILANTDTKALRARAMPRESKGLSPARTARAQALLNAGRTRGEVADMLGVSISTLSNALR